MRTDELPPLDAGPQGRLDAQRPKETPGMCVAVGPVLETPR